MPTLNILAMPVATISQLTVRDDFYYQLNYAYFDIVPVKSSDIRVQNLPTRDDMLEMPIAMLESLRQTAELYEKMAHNLAIYTQLSSQGVVDFLTQEILSTHFGGQIPVVFAKFPDLVTAYKQKFVLPHFNTPLEKSRQVFLLRPKFVLSVLQAYFEQNFSITQASLSQEKFANASFFDGSSEFRVNVTVADVIVPLATQSQKTDGVAYDFAPMAFDIAGNYRPSSGYHFELNSPKLLNDTLLSADKQLCANKGQYLTKIVNQSRTLSHVDNFLSVLQQVGENFREMEAQRLDERFKPNPSR